MVERAGEEEVVGCCCYGGGVEDEDAGGDGEAVVRWEGAGWLVG